MSVSTLDRYRETSPDHPETSPYFHDGASQGRRQHVRRALRLAAGGPGPRRVVVPDPPDWHADPRLPCKLDPERWFADAGPVRDEAVQTCKRSCPRLAECLAAGADEEFGVWGGTTPAERGKRTPHTRGARKCAHPESQLRRSGKRTVCRGCEREAEQARRAPARHPEYNAQLARAAAERRERILAAYHELAPEGLNHVQAAARIGETIAAFHNVYKRAQADGDPRAVPHTAAGRLAHERKAAHAVRKGQARAAAAAEAAS